MAIRSLLVKNKTVIQEVIRTRIAIKAAVAAAAGHVPFFIRHGWVYKSVGEQLSAVLYLNAVLHRVRQHLKQQRRNPLILIILTSRKLYTRTTHQDGKSRKL